MRLKLCLSAALILVSYHSLRAQEMTLESAPPVVVKTVPEAGAKDVDPGLKELKVTFSKDMTPGNFSWSQVSNDSFPKMTGKPKFLADKRTCVLPVTLEPDKTYVLLHNPPKFPGFHDMAGNAAVFYPLVFKTKAAADSAAK